MTSTRDASTALRAEIQACGYFPELVEDSVRLTLGGEEVLDSFVHHEPTFSRDEIHRHVTVLVLTPTRLIVGHVDDHPAEPPHAGTQAAASTESISLSRVTPVAMTRVVTSPEAYHADGEALTETWLSVGWGAVRRVDLEPATCADPDCEADHGFSGTLIGDDLTVRVSAAADGPERTARLVEFATRLQQVAGR